MRTSSLVLRTMYRKAMSEPSHQPIGTERIWPRIVRTLDLWTMVAQTSRHWGTHSSRGRGGVGAVRSHVRE